MHFLPCMFNFLHAFCIHVQFAIILGKKNHQTFKMKAVNFHLCSARPVARSTAIKSAASSGSFAPQQHPWTMSRVAECLAMLSLHSSVICLSQYTGPSGLDRSSSDSRNHLRETGPQLLSSRFVMLHEIFESSASNLPPHNSSGSVRVNRPPVPCTLLHPLCFCATLRIFPSLSNDQAQLN